MIRIAMSIWLLSTALFALEWSKDLDTALEISANSFSKSAIEKIEKSGGKVIFI